ncbi:MAG: 30S ribosomal protein S9 [Nanoarchaeota archaeon]
MKTIVAAGKRKRAIARAVLREGKGFVRINSMLLDAYEPELARMKIMEPLILAGDIAKGVNISVNVNGSGWQSQAEASRLAIARALVMHNKKLKKTFLDYDRHLLISDVRFAEASKPNDSKPRKARQKSYR